MITHTVSPGDTLYGISRKYKIPTSELLKLNNMSVSTSIHPGQQLVVGRGSAGGRHSGRYTVQRGDSLYSIARKFGTSPEHLVRLNALSPSSVLRVGQQLRVPGSKMPSPSAGNTSSSPSFTSTYHTVSRGDSLYSIAKKYGTTPQLLVKMNNLSSQARIFIGQKLKVKSATAAPPPRPEPNVVTAGNVYTVKRGDSLYAIAQKYNTTPQQILRLNGLSENATIYIGQMLKVTEPQDTPPPTNQLRSYTVQRGDFLSKIAGAYNTTPQEIMRLNRLSSGQIYVGQRLLIPQPSTSGSGRQVTPRPVPTPTHRSPGPSVGGSYTPRSNVQVPPHLAGKAAAFEKARSIIKVQATNGIDIFGSGLRGAVGSTYSNDPTDLEKVQLRLVQLGLLPQNHGESPSQLTARLGSSSIGQGSIPKTIAAIRRFQREKRVNYWVSRREHVQMMGTSAYTDGVVMPNDITYKVLREYTDYHLLMPHPTNPHRSISAQFNNFVRSSHNVYYQGIGFKGTFMPDIPQHVFEEFGLSASMALALKYVSKHEGNFDAINSYDKAHFSWGFIQFAGKGGGSNGSLPAVIASMKHKQPGLFREFFQKLGVDIDISFRNGEVHDGNLRIFDLLAYNGRFEVSGEDAERALRNDIQLHGAFIRAAYHPEFYKIQIGRAVMGYVRPAMGIRCDINTGRLRLSDVPLVAIIRSPMGNGLMVDLTVNQWINKTREVFVKAIERVAARSGLHTAAALQNIDERAVLQQINADATDGRIKKRSASILNSSLSAVKAPATMPLA